MKKILTLLYVLLTFALLPTRIMAHCQIPCGIFHDDLVFETLEQNLETLQKADHELSSSTLPSNQSVRWILNKEDQSNQIAQTMLTYFLQQRVKLDDPKRAEKLDLISKIALQCAKVKQTTDAKEVSTLGEEIQQLKGLSGVVPAK
ncbi:MAG: superoxide dismutase, Ni [Chthoniobacterales bacterium]|nr:superoxide dismutase, Ni [Chthoniobacterales bacterium]